MMKGLTDVPGILVGQATDAEAHTGCTVILCGSEAVGGVDIRGSATGTCQVEALSPMHAAGNLHAICLAGGSAFGLEAASGVVRLLEKRGVGVKFGNARVPIVPAAILFDLGIGRPDVRPTREMGEKAALAAHDGPVEEGNVGAGTGCTVGKVFGMKQAMKSGIGSASLTLGSGVMVAAMVAVNALGDVYDGPAILAGARKSADSGEFINSTAAMRHGLGTGGAPGSNTTLAVIATNARFSKVLTNKVAALGSLGVSRTISPVNTMSDGDITFAISLGTLQASVDEVGVAAAEVLAMAVIRAVRAAKSVPGYPGLG